MNKSYKPFSLTTLQLPAPSSNLTKAEYKDTYGINLDDVNIPSFKLVVYGNDKFPIDQIKAIEGGYEVYFAGRILSITDIVQTSDVVYGVENATPIYCHPIVIFTTSGDIKFSLSMLLFNNVPTAYEDFTTLKTELFRIAEVANNANIVCSGKIVDASNSIIASHLYVSSSTISVYGLTSSDTYSAVIITNTTPSISDKVNKIN